MSDSPSNDADKSSHSAQIQASTFVPATVLNRNNLSLRYRNWLKYLSWLPTKSEWLLWTEKVKSVHHL